MFRRTPFTVLVSAAFLAVALAQSSEEDNDHSAVEKQKKNPLDTLGNFFKDTFEKQKEQVEKALDNLKQGSEKTKKDVKAKIDKLLADLQTDIKVCSS